MTRMKLNVSVLCIVVSVCLRSSAATLCKPLSKFKVDCNTCVCGSSGREYTCTDKICPSIDYRKNFDVEENEQGYRILKPKNDGRMVFDVDEDDSVLPNKNGRKTRENQPPQLFINDEIPSSLEEDEIPHIGGNDLDDESDESDEEKTYVDADLEEARQGNEESDDIDAELSSWKHIGGPLRGNVIN